MLPHPALTNEDILHCIFQYFEVIEHWQYATSEVYPDPVENARLQALTASARVCTHFRDAALPVLWKTIGNLTPLWRLLSSCTWTLPNRTTGDSPGTTIYRVNSSSVPSEDLKRLAYYGSLVQAVEPYPVAHYNQPPLYTYPHAVDPSSWPHVEAIVRNGLNVLLPNVRSFSMFFCDPSEVPPLRILVSPSISKMSLKQSRGAYRANGIESHKQQQAAIERLLLEAISVAPGLKAFQLTCDRLSLSSRMASILAQASALRDLDLNFHAAEQFSHDDNGDTLVEDTNTFLDDMSTFLEAFHQLSPLQSLEKLVLTHHLIKNSVSILHSTKIPPAPILPRLRELVLSPGRLPLKLIPIFQLLRSAELQRIQINKLYCGDPAIMHQFCTTIVQCFPSLSSLEFTVTSLPRTLPDLAQVVPLRRVIAPLFQLTSVVSVVIGGILPACITVADDDLKKISASWPHLRALRLPWFPVEERSPNGRQYISLSSLISFAAGCPQLKQLDPPPVDLRACRIQPVHTYPMLNHTLDSLGLGRMVCDDFVSAARILDRIFPHLDVTPSLLRLSMRAAGIHTTAEVLELSSQIPPWEYNLSLAITACQEARREDPWLSFVP